VVYRREELNAQSMQSVSQAFKDINVGLIASEKLSLDSREDFGILGLLGDRALDGSLKYLEEFDCLKIGFFPEGSRLESIRRSLKHLNACIICHGARNPREALTKTVFYFYESLTLPSLLNIDLADVQSIAEGIGISFNVAGNSSKEIIAKLPKESFIARSALLHFSCKKNVTLEEVYKVSKAVSVKKTAPLYLPSSRRSQPDVRKVYKRINIKMGLRVAEDYYETAERPRISLTAILFGI
jgi:hypothetical protein